MIIANRNLEVGQELPPVRKEISFEDMRLFLAGNQNG